MNKQQIILEAFGEVSALFMSQEIKGTEIIMPTEELERIADETLKRLRTKKTIEQAILDKIYYIGNQIPDAVAKDKRSKFVILGTPQKLINETTL